VDAVLRPDRRSALTIVPITVTVRDIVGSGAPKETAWSSTVPEFDGCGDSVELAEYGHNYGVKTGRWEYFSLGWVEYVYCYADQIFLVASDGNSAPRVFDLVWLNEEGQFRGRFLYLFSDAEMIRAPFWIETFDFSAGHISVDRRSGFRCDPNATDPNEVCRVRSALIEIDTTRADGPEPFVSKALAGRLEHRQALRAAGR
jgi:hypothetical protein